MNPKPAAYSIPEFCADHGISRSTYYNLPDDLRPREMRVGKRKLITDESAADWRRMMEARTATEKAEAEAAA